MTNTHEVLKDAARLLDELADTVQERRQRMLEELNELLDTASDDSFTQEVRDWRDQWFEGVEQAQTTELAKSDDAELETQSDAKETPSEDIDDTFGKGTASMLQEEARSADGGVFRDGGLTAGGIFGEGPVATGLHDPAAEARAAKSGAKERRAPGELPEAPKRQLSQKHYKKLLKEKDDE